MPELPEVETVRIQLADHILGKTITKTEVYHQKTVDHEHAFSEKLENQTIKDIARIGKLLIFSFTKQDNLFMLAHLKMTGQFFYTDKTNLIGGGHSMTERDRSKLPGPHTRTVFHFTDGSTLYFNDMRLFGYTKLADSATVEMARSGFGPEPIDVNFDLKWFADTLRKRNTPVKAALLDQSFVSGLGNIYVDEALFRAGIRPTRRAKRVTKSEATTLGVACGNVMNESIAVGGTTFQHFLDAEGNTGNFTEHLRIFGKQNTPCHICGTTIKKIRVAGRGTHYCPICQT